MEKMKSFLHSKFEEKNIWNTELIVLYAVDLFKKNYLKIISDFCFAP